MTMKVSAPVTQDRRDVPANTFLARRVLAGLLDLALVLLPAMLLIGRRRSSDLIDNLDIPVILVGCAGAVVVGLVIPTVTGGRTPGKLLFGLSVQLEDGGRPTIRHHGLRAAASIADLMPGVVPGLTGFAVAASSPRRQRLGDRLAGTNVIDLTASTAARSEDNHLNHGHNSADNSETRPAFSVPEPPSEVFNMNDTDDSRTGENPVGDEAREASSVSEPVEVEADRPPVDDEAETTTVDSNSDSCDDQAAESAAWAEGTVSSFAVSEVVEDPAEQTVDETTIEADSANPGDTQKSRLIEVASVDEQSSAAAYPLPSHRRARNQSAAAESDASVVAEAKTTALPVAAPIEVPIAASEAAAEADTVEADPQAGPPDTVQAEQVDEEHEAEEIEEVEEVDELEAVPVSQDDSSETFLAAEPEDQSADADPATPVWNEDWHAWICWNDAEQAWLRYDDAIGEWLSMDVEAAEL